MECAKRGRGALHQSRGSVARACGVALALALAAGAQEADEPAAKFGTTVYLPAGLRGEIYKIGRRTKELPDFEGRKPVGSIYTSELDVQPQSFDHGFPGVTKRYEWFAIDYRGRFWVEKPGPYRFSLLSDDGSKLYIDGVEVVNNDGLHPPQERNGSVELARGVHAIRVSYFQGPRFEVALVLRVAGEGEPWRVFTTEEWKPPPDAEAP